MVRETRKVTEEQGIRYFPIGLFASVMGFAGVTIAVKQAETLYHLNNIVSNILLSITSLLFLINAGVLIYRIIQHREEVKKDFNHPVKMNFFATISISLLLLAVAYFDFSKYLSFTLWIFGALTQISLTLVILSKLIWQHSFQMMQFNPAWFIPIVGNIVVPLAGTSHITADVNWLFFSIGVFFSIIYMTIFFNRIFFHPAMPEKLLPTFFILMAPPAIGFVSYVKIAETIDAFAYILYGTAFFIGLLLLFQINRFVSIPFSISWWAFLFPSAAMTIATGIIYTMSMNHFYKWIFAIQIIGLIVLAIYLASKTIQLIVNRTLCLKES